MNVRSYRLTDLVGVLALQQNSDADLGASVPDDFYNDLRDIEVAYHSGAFVVAEDDNAVVGMGGLLSTGEVVRMRVSAEYRRQGIASKILATLLARAQELGMTRVYLHALIEQTAAQELYLAGGFHEAGQGEVHGNAVVRYERTLEQSGTNNGDSDGCDAADL